MANELYSIYRLPLGTAWGRTGDHGAAPPDQYWLKRISALYTDKADSFVLFACAGDVGGHVLAIHEENGSLAAMELCPQAVSLRNILERLIVRDKRLTVFAKAGSVVSLRLLGLDALLHLQKHPKA
jgi:hypothetical protein